MHRGTAETGEDRGRRAEWSGNRLLSGVQERNAPTRGQLASEVAPVLTLDGARGVPDLSGATASPHADCRYPGSVNGAPGRRQTPSGFPPGRHPATPGNRTRPAAGIPRWRRRAEPSGLCVPFREARRVQNPQSARGPRLLPSQPAGCPVPCQSGFARLKATSGAWGVPGPAGPGGGITRRPEALVAGPDRTFRQCREVPCRTPRRGEP